MVIDHWSKDEGQHRSKLSTESALSRIHGIQERILVTALGVEFTHRDCRLRQATIDEEVDRLVRVQPQTKTKNPDELRDGQFVGDEKLALVQFGD